MAMFEFYYDYVQFGTKFGKSVEEKHSGVSRRDYSTCLLSNEIVADVGGECCGYVSGQNEGQPERMIFDHHFQRENQFPSAAAAVLHHTEEIKDWSEGLAPVDEGDSCTVWLLTHRTPDFDAFCSLYLIRKIIEGQIPEVGWERFGIAPGAWTKPSDTEKIDWFSPPVSPHDEKKELSYAWPLLLASYASHVDNGRLVATGRTRALHSVLYAGSKRGRKWEQNGATDFFDTVVRSICEYRLNPLVDDVFVNAQWLTPELLFLDGEEQRYLRDLEKARKTVVSVQVAQFEEWFDDVSEKPLLDENHQINADHLYPGQDGANWVTENTTGSQSTIHLKQFDGVYIRDPESLLFKEWARTDQEHSPMKGGFIFTAVAYSRGVPNSDSQNTSRYFFALDPERAGSAHLYNVWARLQAAEMKARDDLNPVESRSGFGPREVGIDPWFDGNTYRATIVDTPDRGTQIEPKLKIAPDLSDDRVATLVERELEYAPFGVARGRSGSHMRVLVKDYSTGAEQGNENRHKQVQVSDATSLSLPDDTLRFVAVPLHEVDLSLRIVAEEIGRKIWPFLEDAGIRTVPTDFLERHLISHPHYVAVWSRVGIVVAYKEKGEGLASRVDADLKALAEILRDLHTRIDGDDERTARKRLQDTVALKKRVVGLKIEAATPQMLPLRRLLESRKFEAVLSSLQSLDQEEFHKQERRREREQKRRDFRLQAALAGVAILGLILAWNQVEVLSLKSWTAWEGPPLIRLVLGILSALCAIGVPLLLLRLIRRGDP